MECEFVQQMRNFIKVVADFTKQKVDILGHSLVSPIVRKAILGGKCVQAQLKLTFQLQEQIKHPIFVFCLSLMPNINSVQRYEGSHIYSIYGTQDDKVGYLNLPCFTKNSQINNSDQEFSNATGNHDAILSGTIDLQMNLLNAH
ncbi:hypothetical protein L3Y34_017781 [Caenorhabditis briggsae]|uniref:Uncharacterized protein n=1 Tax=Caenorhabditis briggsae TaxID=6238 RepID=A0AAE9IU39_CAEBR|nr:hypothetical protein L3Y34_017781 [Caenorhabditis briggsae]